MSFLKLKNPPLLSVVVIYVIAHCVVISLYYRVENTILDIVVAHVTIINSNTITVMYYWELSYKYSIP